MSDRESGFCMGWVAGPSAEIELYGPGKGREPDRYYMRYTPAFRSTIRPPLEERFVGPQDLERISQRLDKLAQAATPRSGSAEGGEESSPVDRRILYRDMTMLGSQLYDFLLPTRIKRDLTEGGLFLEVGVDKAHVHFPWELMHDGDNFLCLKHALGRFVNADVIEPAMLQRPSTPLGSTIETLSVLIICVHAPQPREGMRFDLLPKAEEERDEVLNILGNIEGIVPDVLSGRRATHDEVYTRLKQNEYHIIHYIGHARFDHEREYNSSLVLYDEDMTTGKLKGIIGERPPILCFINGCETGRVAANTSLKYSFDIYGLARAFLDTGAYLIGSRWKVNDQTAVEFAKPFYNSLFKERKPIGEALIDARRACQMAVPEDVSGWSSYVFYGDPRVCFRMP
jgi:CHAT domain-containing protein